MICPPSEVKVEYIISTLTIEEVTVDYISGVVEPPSDVSIERLSCEET